MFVFSPAVEGRGGRTKLHVDADKGEVVVEGDESRDRASREDFGLPTVSRTASRATSRFRFANTFEAEDNLSIFQTVGRPLVESVMVGFNGTLFAYGQTGSGKTYTIGEISRLGSVHEGVAHRMIRALYELAAQERKATMMEYTVGVQYVQIYLERVYDLLSEGATRGHAESSSLALREGKEGVFVEGATTHAADTDEDCLALLTRGSKNLKIAETQMNRTSSRSHSVCRLFVEGRQTESPAPRTARGRSQRGVHGAAAHSPIGVRMPSPMERRASWLSRAGAGASSTRRGICDAVGTLTLALAAALAEPPRSFDSPLLAGGAAREPSPLAAGALAGVVEPAPAIHRSRSLMLRPETGPPPAPAGSSSFGRDRSESLDMALERDIGQEVDHDDGPPYLRGYPLPPAPPPSLSRELSMGSPSTPSGRKSLRASFAAGFVVNGLQTKHMELRRRQSMASEVTPTELDGTRTVDLAAWRRHSVAMISELIEQAVTTNGSTKATMTLCDLAGSEDVGRSGATGLTLSEAKKINTSLLALGNVIHALTKEHGRSAHVPFRDSVLTRLLQESIGGDCKTSLVVCVSPADADKTETLSTLRFAARAKLVKNVAKAHATIDVTDLSSRLQMGRLTEQLQQQLDESEKRLHAAQVNMEHRAATALQLASRVKIKEMAIRTAMKNLSEERVKITKQADEVLHTMEEQMERRLREEREEAASSRAQLEAQVAASERARADETAALRRQLNAVEAKMAAEAAAASRGVSDAEAEAKATERNAKLEVSRLQQLHAAEVSELEATLVTETERLLAAHAAALSAKGAAETELASQAAEAAAEASAREAKLNERIEELATSLEIARQQAESSGQQMSEAVAKERMERESAQAMLEESKKAAEEARAAKCAAKLAAEKAAEEKIVAAVEAAKAHADAEHESALREQVKAAAVAQVEAVDQAVHTATFTTKAELFAAFEKEKAAAVAAAKAEGKREEAFAAEARLEQATGAAAAEMESALELASSQAAANLAGALAEARKQAVAALEEALAACRAQAEAEQSAAVQEAVFQERVDAEAAAEAASYEHAAELANASEEAKAMRATEAEEAAQVEEALREEMSIMEEEHALALETAQAELGTAREVAHAAHTAHERSQAETFEALSRAREEADELQERAQSALAEVKFDAAETERRLRAEMQAMASECKRSHAAALEEHRGALAVAREEVERQVSAAAKAAAESEARRHEEVQSARTEHEATIATTQEAAAQQNALSAAALAAAQEATTRARSDANATLAALAEMRTSVEEANARAEALDAECDRLRSQHAASLTGASAQASATLRHELGAQQAAHAETLAQRTAAANERVAAATEREQALLAQIDVLHAEVEGSARAAAELAAAEATRLRAEMRREEAARLRTEVYSRLSALQQQCDELQGRCERAEVERERAKGLQQQVVIEKAEALAAADSLKAELDHVMRASVEAASEATVLDHHVEVVLETAAARVAQLEAEALELSTPRYRGRDVFQHTRVRLAESLATFEQHDLIESEIRPAEHAAPPKVQPDMGKWRYDASLGRAVRYGTTPVVETRRRRDRGRSRASI